MLGKQRQRGESHVPNIELKNKDAILKLSEEACKYEDSIYVHSDDDMVMIDAKSLLALFSLIGQPCHLVAEDNFNPRLLEKIAKRAGVTV